MRILSTCLLLIAMCCSVNTFAGNQYQLDMDQIDQLFEVSTEVSSSNFMLTDVEKAVNPSAPAPPVAKMIGGNGDQDPVIAFVLATFLGYIGIHRIYLGTSVGTFIGYILTLGGCGIISFVDWIMLLIGLIDDDVSDYTNNSKFFMWAG